MYENNNKNKTKPKTHENFALFTSPCMLHPAIVNATLCVYKFSVRAETAFAFANSWISLVFVFTAVRIASLRFSKWNDWYQFIIALSRRHPGLLCIQKFCVDVDTDNIWCIILSILHGLLQYCCCTFRHVAWQLNVNFAWNMRKIFTTWLKIIT